MPSILVVSGKSKGYYYDLPDRAVTVGRDEKADVQILDEMVSRSHMEIVPEGDSHRARDLDSANGVFVNGRQITTDVPLQDGDAIVIGESKIHYSSRNYPGYDAALSAIKQRGERGKSTLIQ